MHPPGEGLGDGVLSPGCMWRGALPAPGRVTPPGAISEAGQLDAVLRCRRPLVVLSPAPQAVFRGLQPLTPVPTVVFPADKPEEIVPASKPSRAAESVAVESRVATIKQRPTSRCFPAVSVSDMNVSGGPGREAGGLPGPMSRHGARIRAPRKVMVLSGVSGHSCSPGLGPQMDTGGPKPCGRRPLPGVSVSPSGLGHCGGAGPGAPHPASGLQSVYERQGIAVMTPTVPGSPKGPFLGLPRGTMRRQKSIGKKHGHTRRGCPWALRAPQQCPRTPRPAQEGAPGLTRCAQSPGWFLRTSLSVRPAG